VCGARPGIAKYLPETSKSCEGKTIDEITDKLPELHDSAILEAELNTNSEATAEYRKQLLKVFIEKGFMSLSQLSKDEGI
jgi:phage portal protein BeeE